MKKGFNYSLLLLLPWLLWASCNKEQVEKGPANGNGECMVAYTFRLADATQTKANGISDVAIDDAVKRLDLFVFYKNKSKPDEHVTYLPQAGETVTHRVTAMPSEQSGVLAIANLDEDTADFLEGKSLEELTQKGCSIILDAGNFAFDRIPMFGTGGCSHESSRNEVEINLNRLMTRLNIEKLSVEFEDKSLWGKKVQVRNIAVINAPNYFIPLEYRSFSYFPLNNTMCFGIHSDYLTGTFGDITSGYKRYMSHSDNDYNSPINVKGPGKLTAEYRHLYNRNFKNGKDELYIDATGLQEKMYVQHYSSDEGIIVQEGDMEPVHSLEIDRCFYTSYCHGSWLQGMPCDFRDQGESQKLVIELLINGEIWFYPIQLDYIQPNTVYNIKKITIRGYGSKYANVIEKKYSYDYSMTIMPWTSLDVDNVYVGVDPSNGQPVDPDTGNIVAGKIL